MEHVKSDAINYFCRFTTVIRVDLCCYEKTLDVHTYNKKKLKNTTDFSELGKIYMKS